MGNTGSAPASTVTPNAIERQLARQRAAAQVPHQDHPQDHAASMHPDGQPAPGSAPGSEVQRVMGGISRENAVLRQLEQMLAANGGTTPARGPRGREQEDVRATLEAAIKAGDMSRVLTVLPGKTCPEGQKVYDSSQWRGTYLAPQLPAHLPLAVNEAGYCVDEAEMKRLEAYRDNPAAAVVQHTLDLEGADTSGKAAAREGERRFLARLEDRIEDLVSGGRAAMMARAVHRPVLLAGKERPAAAAPAADDVPSAAGDAAPKTETETKAEGSTSDAASSDAAAAEEAIEGGEGGAEASSPAADATDEAGKADDAEARAKEDAEAAARAAAEAKAKEDAEAAARAAAEAKAKEDAEAAARAAAEAKAKKDAEEAARKDDEALRGMLAGVADLAIGGGAGVGGGVLPAGNQKKIPAAAADVMARQWRPATVPASWLDDALAGVRSRTRAAAQPALPVGLFPLRVPQGDALFLHQCAPTAQGESNDAADEDPWVPLLPTIHAVVMAWVMMQLLAMLEAVKEPSVLAHTAFGRLTPGAVQSKIQTMRGLVGAAEALCVVLDRALAHDQDFAAVCYPLGRALSVMDLQSIGSRWQQWWSKQTAAFNIPAYSGPRGAAAEAAAAAARREAQKKAQAQKQQQQQSEGGAKQQDFRHVLKRTNPTPSAAGKGEAGDAKDVPGPHAEAATAAPAMVPVRVPKLAPPVVLEEGSAVPPVDPSQVARSVRTTNALALQLPLVKELAALLEVPAWQGEGRKFILRTLENIRVGLPAFAQRVSAAVFLFARAQFLVAQHLPRRVLEPLFAAAGMPQALAFPDAAAGFTSLLNRVLQLKAPMWKAPVQAAEAALTCSRALQALAMSMLRWPIVAGRSDALPVRALQLLNTTSDDRPYHSWWVMLQFLGPGVVSRLEGAGTPGAAVVEQAIMEELQHPEYLAVALAHAQQFWDRHFDAADLVQVTLTLGKQRLTLRCPAIGKLERLVADQRK